MAIHDETQPHYRAKPYRSRTVRTVTALVVLTTLGAGGLTACAALGGAASGAAAAPEGWEQHSSGGVSFSLPSGWEYHERLTWPGAWTPPGSDDGADSGPNLTVQTVDSMSADVGTGAPGAQVDIPGADSAEFWHHDIPPEGGDLHEILVMVDDFGAVQVTLTAGDLSDAESLDLFETVVGTIRVDGEDDYEAAEKYGPAADLTRTDQPAALPDLGDLPSGIPDGWDFAGPEGLRIGLPAGWSSDPGSEGAAWIHPGTGARIRADEATSSDTWEPARDGTRFAMPGADIAVASAYSVTDGTGQELVEVQIDIRREGGRGYTAFVDAPAADLADLLIPFLGSLSFEPEAGGTGWVNDLPEYPHLAAPPASWTETQAGPFRLSVPADYDTDTNGEWTTWATPDEEFELTISPMDTPIESQGPGQTSVPMAGATSVLVQVVEDHDLGPEYFVGVVEIVLESGEVYSLAYNGPREEAEKAFGQILGSLTVDEDS